MRQDYRFIKKITKPMKGFKAFHAADATLTGVELHHMSSKVQHIQSVKQIIFEQFFELAQNNPVCGFEKNLRQNRKKAILKFNTK